MHENGELMLTWPRALTILKIADVQIQQADRRRWVLVLGIKQQAFWNYSIASVIVPRNLLSKRL